jgi:4-hydroxybenzoate polyprenyltransferase
MVVIGNHIIALIRLIRLPNLLIVAATQILIRYCVILPLLEQGQMNLQLAGGLFAWLVVATVLITAGGYVINDYFDRKMDRVNKPDSVIVGRLIYPRHAMAYHLFFSIMGVLIGTWISYKAGLLYLSFVFFMVSGLLWFYSTTYKRELLLGNIIVALLTALVPFMVLLYELPLLARSYGSTVTHMIRYLMIWVLGFSLFAFLLNLIREIIKDAEDFEGDQAYGKKTVPVIWGMKVTRWITAVLLLITILLLILAWYFFIPDRITLIYFMLLLIIPIFIVTGLVLKGSSRRSFHIASAMLKLVMIAGLVYMIAVNFLINRLT